MVYSVLRQQSESVGGRAHEAVLASDPLGEGGDYGFTIELHREALGDQVEDFGDMEGSASGSQYVMYHVSVRHTFPCLF
jgi:hypothetical protein